jgi:hypothetical protein
MDEIIVTIDSLKRDITKPNTSESNFLLKLDRTLLDNAVSVRLASIEMPNSINLVSAQKNNNYFTIYLPNKICDPKGFKVTLPDGLTQDQVQYVNSINTVFNNNFNNNYVLGGYQYNGELSQEFSEKYFYFFYMPLPTTITIYYNVDSNGNNMGIPTDASKLQPSLNHNFILPVGWYSMYGFVLQLQSYIQYQYNLRQQLLRTPNSNLTPISFDNGNFSIKSFNINVYDRRLRKDTTIPNNIVTDCVRQDFIDSNSYLNGNISSNLDDMKYYIYEIYIWDTTYYILNSVGDVVDPKNGILDNLNCGVYKIPYGYLTGGTLFSIDPVTYKLYADNTNGSAYLRSYSRYYINNKAAPPMFYGSVQSYNLKLYYDVSLSKFKIINSFSKVNNPLNTPFYYYYIDNMQQSWTPTTSDNIDAGDNIIDNLLDQFYLNWQGFLSNDAFNSWDTVVDLTKDITQFMIDFTTGDPILPLSNVNGAYQSIGYYMGYRPNSNGSYLLTPSLTSQDTDLILAATNVGNLNGSIYLYLCINDGNSDWGYISNFTNNQNIFAKILLPSSLSSNDYGTYSTNITFYNPTFKFQNTNIKILKVCLLDHLANQVDLNGVDWSCTLVVIKNKDNIDIKKNGIFNNNHLIKSTSNTNNKDENKGNLNYNIEKTYKRL